MNLDDVRGEPRRDSEVGIVPVSGDVEDEVVLLVGGKEGSELVGEGEVAPGFRVGWKRKKGKSAEREAVRVKQRTCDLCLEVFKDD